jgi:hypothetical protein
MPQYQVRDEQTGKTITFEWHGQGEPTEADMAEVFAEASKAQPQAAAGGSWTDSLPAAGAMAGSLVGGSKISPIGMALAGVGGAAGEAFRQVADSVRGDFSNVPETVGGRLKQIGAEGLKQAGIEGLGRGVSALIAKPARALYRGVIPKNIQDKFSTANLAQSGLDSRVVLGTKSGTGRAQAASTRANQGVHAAADTVPALKAADVQEAFKPKYNKALSGGKTDKAIEINAHVKKSMDEIGPNGFVGKQQLARKEFLEQEGKAAMGAANPNMMAVNPQLANIERKAIVKNMRKSPEMATALNKSQASIGVERAARATENSSVMNRLAHGGVWNAMRSPSVLSGTAIGLHELSRIPYAQLVRMAQLSQLQDDQQ